MRVFDHLLKAVRGAADFNPEVQVAPSCILWPDKDRQWEAAIPRMRDRMAELLVLGEYAPEDRVGPAIWLRCVIAGKLAEVSLPAGGVPVLYLPGVSRQDLRAIEECPDGWKPLAELQYRGKIWSQINNKDWTILAFLKSDEGGLGLEVAQDNVARDAMQLALDRLLDEDLEQLKGRWLDKDYFNTLLIGGDLPRDLLRWLDLGDEFKTSCGVGPWRGFVEVCKSQLAFNPEAEGSLAGARKLAMREGPWEPVWNRYCEAPQRYPNIPTLIRQCRPPDLSVLDSPAEKLRGWPQWNDDQESLLKQEWLGLKQRPAHDARRRVLELEKAHALRRDLVWAGLGESPLALASAHLAVIAEVTRTPLAAGSIEDLQVGFTTQGWRADDAVLSALQCVEKSADLPAVTEAIRAIYLPWIEESARYLQQLVDRSGYPGGTIATARAFAAAKGECVLFVDGLRFDTARRLRAVLEGQGGDVAETPTWTALPSVTATGKAAASPVRTWIGGADDCVDFEPCVAATGQSLRGGYHLRKLLTEHHWKVLDLADQGDGQGNAWCEFGDIDSEGHHRGWKLARQIDSLLAEIADRIAATVPFFASVSPAKK
jgi:hypothetical protein